MEKIQDFFKHIGERLRNPFLFSYLISWLIVNYKVVVGLFFYKLNDYESYINLIEKETSWKTNFLYPVIGAFIYTILIPLLKREIILFHTWINQGQEKRTLNILKEGYISTDKYLRLRDSYKQSQAKLVEVIDDESKFLKQRNDLNEQVTNLRTELIQSNDKLNTLEKEIAPLKILKTSTDLSFLSGRWTGAYNRIDVGSLTTIDFNLEQKTIKITGIKGNKNINAELFIDTIMKSNKIIYLDFLQTDNFPIELDRYFIFRIHSENNISGQGQSGSNIVLERAKL